jgi:hypothetical protein
MSSASKLRSRLSDIAERVSALVRSTPVEQVNTGAIIYVGPRFHFGQLSAEQQRAQLEIKRDYDRWIERVRVLFVGAPDKLKRQLQKIDDACSLWVEQKANWVVRPDPDHNVHKAEADFAAAADILDVLGPHDARTFVVPDTNSLLQNPDPTVYRSVVGTDTFTFVLMPTVLRELDELKILHRNPDVREKAQKTITRIKGWRGQGALFDGVTVDRTITVQAIPQEPNVASTLSWLDPSSADDRILASVLHLEAKVPTSRIMLVTGDINLMNKADAAQIETGELP